MLIHCTKKMCEKLKTTLSDAPTEYEPLYSWRVNVVEEGRRRFVVFMNDASRYTVVLNGVKAKDWSKLSSLFIQTLREVMLAEQVNPDVIDSYLENAGKPDYVRNTDRQMTSWVNKACENACIAYRTRDTNVDLSLFVNHFHVGTKDEKDYWQPSERMFERLAVYGLPVKKCRAFELSIRLMTLGGWVRRKILVPTTISFEQLQTVINQAYGWWRDHQFNFMLYKDGVFGENPDLMLFEERDPSSFPEGSKVMTDIRLNDYLPKYRHFQYLYDYAADWHLYVEVTDIIEDCTEDLPCLLSGEGDAPPEDVGGAEGYAEFLDVLANGKYAERYEKKRWGKSYGWEHFDLECVNKQVQRSLKW